MTDSSQFDQAAKAWDEDPGRVRLAQAVASAMVGSLGLDGSRTVLDYGAGTGLVSFALLPHVKRVLAADTSEEMLTRIRAKVASTTGAAVEPRAYSLGGEWPFSARPDMISASMVLHHMADTAASARLFAGLLPPGGLLAVADLDTEDGSFHGDRMHTEHKGFDRAALGDIFRQAGFEDVAFHEVLAFTRPGPDGEPRTFTVFLMTGRKA